MWHEWGMETWILARHFLAKSNKSWFATTHTMQVHINIPSQYIKITWLEGCGTCKNWSLCGCESYQISCIYIPKITSYNILFAVAGTWTSMTELCQPDTVYLLWMSNTIHLTTTHMHSIKLKYYGMVMLAREDHPTSIAKNGLASYLFKSYYVITAKSRKWCTSN